jgi:hypothetical protein
LRCLALGSPLRGVLLRQVSSHHAATDGPDDRVLSGVVASYTADHRAFQAAILHYIWNQGTIAWAIRGQDAAKAPAVDTKTVDTFADVPVQS